jgi:hypothetical protein
VITAGDPGDRGRQTPLEGRAGRFHVSFLPGSRLRERRTRLVKIRSLPVKNASRGWSHPSSLRKEVT